MSERIVTIYKRKDGIIYLHRHDKSSMGIFIGCPPFIKIDPCCIEQLPNTVNELLAVEPKVIEHPKTFNQLDPLYKLAGCGNWKNFASGTLCFEISNNNGEIKLSHTKKDGAGFTSLPDPVSLGTSVEFEILLKAAPELSEI